MAITAKTTRPVQFLRRFSGAMEPPVYEFPVIQTATTWRKGDGVVIAAANEGKVTKATGAGGTGIPIATLTGIGLVGFYYGPSSSAPPFPTETGVQGVYTSPAAVTTNDPIPDNEKIAVVLALPDCIFMGHQTNGETDIVAPIRAPSAIGTGGVLRRMGLSVIVPTGESSRVLVDSSVDGADVNQISMPLNWAYPQLPAARGTTGMLDPFAIRLGANGTVNPAVEFYTLGTLWSTTV